MGLPELKTLLDSDPANTTRTDAEVLAWLNEPNPSGVRASATYNAFELMDNFGASPAANFLDKLDTFSATADALAPVVKWLMPFFTTTGVDFGNSKVLTLLSTLQSQGVITNGELNAASGLARVLTRWEAANASPPTLGNIERWRTGGI